MRELGGDTARTADPSWPKEHSVPCSVDKLGELARGSQRSLLGAGLGIVHLVVSNCICASLVFCSIIIVIIIVTSSFAFLLNCLYLNLWVFTFSHSPPHPVGVR